LKKLRILRHTNNSSIIDYDSIIEDCPKLISLQLNIYQKTEYPTTDKNTKQIRPSLDTITPRYGIKTLKMNWEIIRDDEILTYMMRKFPNLNQLHIYSCANIRQKNYSDTPSLMFNEKQPCEISEEAMVNFFKYLAKIPSVKVELAFGGNIMLVLRKFMQEETQFQGAGGSISFGYYRDAFAAERYDIECKNYHPNIRFQRTPKLQLTSLYFWK
jgi:hypothetical protein